MKKILYVLVAVFSLGILNVNAITKEELQDKITKSYTINGEIWQVEEKDYVLIERYFNQNEISENDLEYISKKIDEVVLYLEQGNAKNPSEVTEEEIDYLIQVVNDVSSKTAIKATIENGRIVIYNPDGTKFAELTDLVKETGRNDFYLILSSVMFVSGVLVLARKKANA